MKRNHFDDSQDQRVAREGTDSRQNMCTANGCPNLWSTSNGNLCRWHADAEPRTWPEVTRQMQDDEVDRARMRNEPTRPVAPLTPADKMAILARLQTVFTTARQDPKAWAKRLRDREASGDRLNERQRTMWRAALSSEIAA